MVKMNDAKLTQIEQAAQDALVATAKEVLKEARKLVPRDRGKLSSSGRVEADWKSVAVAFRQPYAWIQHERLDFQHEQGQAKYLEAAVDNVGVEAKVAQGVRVRIR